SLPPIRPYPPRLTYLIYPADPRHEPLSIDEVGADGGGRAAVERHDAFLAALPEHPNHLRADVQIVHVEARQLGQPEPRGVEQLENRAVAAAERRGELCRPDEGRHPV